MCSPVRPIGGTWQKIISTQSAKSSRTFHRLMDFYDYQVFSGPPENSHDFVAAAAKALAAGEYFQFLISFYFSNNPKYVTFHFKHI
jgi:hypothetical protein